MAGMLDDMLSHIMQKGVMESWRHMCAQQFMKSHSPNAGETVYLLGRVFP